MAHSKGFLAAANFMDAVASVALPDFDGGGLWRWPFFVEEGLALAEAACFVVRQLRQSLQVQILVDSVALD